MGAKNPEMSGTVSAFSPTGDRLAVSYKTRRDEPCQITIYKLFPGAPNVCTLLTNLPMDAHTDGICALQFSPLGTWLASCAEDGRVRLWTTATWELKPKSLNHPGQVHQAVFSPDEAEFLTACTSVLGQLDTLSLWNVPRNSLALPLLTVSNQMVRVSYSSRYKDFVYSVINQVPALGLPHARRLLPAMNQILDPALMARAAR
ncbi:MAG: hypothetical protein EXS36_02185 [Pedosphaera sp.]|nr:hypothetical protein [Pedosphaera sp.]